MSVLKLNTSRSSRLAGSSSEGFVRSANSLSTMAASTPKLPQMVSQTVVSAATTAAVVAGRSGTVLDASTLIKVDDYHQNRKRKAQPDWFPKRVSGADMLRVVPGTSIIGVSQPSLSGVRGILNTLHSGRLLDPNNPQPKKVLWINLREEPLLYVNGRSVVLRERREPFRNMDSFRGISESRLRDLEWRLKEDVVAEAQRNGGSFVLHEELEYNVLSELWESAPPNAVMTAEEIFFQLRQEGYRVKYERIPCTSGEAPALSFFDDLLKCVQEHTDRETWIVFNCQSGQARSTLGMVAASLVQSRRGFLHVPITELAPEVPTSGAGRGMESISLGRSLSSASYSATSPLFPQQQQHQHQQQQKQRSPAPPALAPAGVLSSAASYVTSPSPLPSPLGSTMDPPTRLTHPGTILTAMTASAPSSPPATPPPPPPSTTTTTSSESHPPAPVVDEEPSIPRDGNVALNDDDDAVERQLLAGWFTPVLQALRLLGGGRDAKSRVDLFTDMCSHTTHIRTEIFSLRAKAANIRGQSMARFALSRASVALQRYMLLILFEAYLEERAVREGGRYQVDAISTGFGGLPSSSSTNLALGGSIQSALNTPILSSSLHPSANGSEVMTATDVPLAKQQQQVPLRHAESSSSSFAQQPLFSSALPAVHHARSVSRDYFSIINAAATATAVATTTTTTTTNSSSAYVQFSLGYRPTFQEWVEQRKEIVALLTSVQAVPTAALEAPGPTSTVVEASSEARRVVMGRRGVMLNTDTILKLDNYDAQQRDAGEQSGPYDSAENASDLEATDDASLVGARNTNNFRKIPGMRVYGVATLPAFQFRNLTRRIQSEFGASNVLFGNLREEPLVYINQKPFVLRSVHRPFRNLDAFADIDAERLEKAEERLKQDVILEAKRCNGRVLLHTEAADGSLRVVWEDIDDEDEDAVQTPKDVFAKFRSEEALHVTYRRIPITPESVPSLTDIDDILRTVHTEKKNPGTHFVFFCQRGRGRSTLATILACLELDELAFTTEDNTETTRWVPNMTAAAGTLVMETTTSTSATTNPGDAAAAAAVAARATPVPSSSTTDLQLLHHHQIHRHQVQDKVVVALDSSHTDFPPLLALIRVLRHGPLAKRWLDDTIDRCGAVFNVRQNVLNLALQSVSARSAEQAHALVENALFDLQKYFVLLEAAGFCAERKTASNQQQQQQSQQQQQQAQSSFKQWCAARPELLTLKEDIRNEDALRIPGITDVAGHDAQLHQQQQDPSQADGGGDGNEEDDFVMGASAQPIISNDFAVVMNRKGRVLVRGSILKTDHFPGCKRLTDAAVEIEGAPNFRSVWPEGPIDGIDLRVYGTAIPTISALDEILEMLLLQSREPIPPPSSSSLYTAGQQGSAPKKPPTPTAAQSTPVVVWVNLREEPILYVNGRPFVLRRLDHPLANLEHTGISRARVEEMEIRFKEDVLDEASANEEGCILIHEEDEGGALRPRWEKLDSVFTPRELFETKSRTYPLEYYRIPITDEQAPKPSAFDSIVDIVGNIKPSYPVVFNCQMGRGRTTTGLVVASATRLRKIGLLRGFGRTVDEKIVPRGRKFRSKIRGKSMGAFPDGAATSELKGDFLAVLAQVRLMDDGLDAKSAMDALIDVCDAMQNLREAIKDAKSRANAVDLPPRERAEAVGVAEHYLRRYCHLVQFTAYLISLPDVEGQKRVRFASWLKARPELGNALRVMGGSKAQLST